jgi:hypothetical protein
MKPENWEIPGPDMKVGAVVLEPFYKSLVQIEWFHFLVRVFLNSGSFSHKISVSLICSSILLLAKLYHRFLLAVKETVPRAVNQVQIPLMNYPGRWVGFL